MSLPCRLQIKRGDMYAFYQQTLLTILYSLQGTKGRAANKS